MFGEMLDTSPEARRFYYQKLRELSGQRRLEMMGSTSSLTRRMAEAGIKREHPQISPEELRVRLAVRLYGRELAQRFLGPLPMDAR
jgi:hypothetical protein